MVFLPRHATDEIPVELGRNETARHLAEVKRQVPLLERAIDRCAELVEKAQERNQGRRPTQWDGVWHASDVYIDCRRRTVRPVRANRWTAQTGYCALRRFARVRYSRGLTPAILRKARAKWEGSL